MSKKGISPLIATVLIIGFTIVLAALVMQWGGGLFKSVQDQTSKTSDFKIICSSKLTGLEVTAKVADVTIDNKNNQNIKGFLFRVYQNGVVTSTKNTAVAADQTVCPLVSQVRDCTLPAYGMKTFTVASLVGGQVGVFPIVTIQNEDMTCENEWKVTTK